MLKHKKGNMKKSIKDIIIVIFLGIITPTCGLLALYFFCQQSQALYERNFEIEYNDLLKRANEQKEARAKVDTLFITQIQENEKDFNTKDSAIIHLDSDATIDLLAKNLSLQDSTWYRYARSDNDTTSKADK
jgi:hypothetical protein